MTRAMDLICKTFSSSPQCLLGILSVFYSAIAIPCLDHDRYNCRDYCTDLSENQPSPFSSQEHAPCNIIRHSHCMLSNAHI